MSNQNNDDIFSKENLSKYQAENLEFIEKYTDKKFKVSQVPVLKMLVYEFIQVLNNLTIRELIAIDESEEVNEEEDLVCTVS